MMIHSEISFWKRRFDDGFGFTCMKTAYALGIRGKMIYGQDTGVHIQAEGEHEKIGDFINWIKINLKEDEQEITCITGIYSGSYSEFDIYRQEYMPGAISKQSIHHQKNR